MSGLRTGGGATAHFNELISRLEGQENHRQEAEKSAERQTLNLKV